MRGQLGHRRCNVTKLSTLLLGHPHRWTMTFIGRHCTTSEKPIHVDTASIPIKTFDRFMRPSRRHWRLLAFVGLLAFVVLVLFDSQVG